jgi:hypothetical protein
MLLVPVGPEPDLDRERAVYGRDQNMYWGGEAPHGLCVARRRQRAPNLIRKVPRWLDMVEQGLTDGMLQLRVLLREVASEVERGGCGTGSGAADHKRDG